MRANLLCRTLDEDDWLRQTFAQHIGPSYREFASARQEGSAVVSTFNLLLRHMCGSACKKDPVSGVIGVQKGPLISMV